MGNETTAQRMKILSIYAKNVKCVREVQIDDVGEILDVRGDSGQGKSTILDAIRGGIESLDPSMVTNGADAAEIRLEFDLATIKRIIHSDGARDYLSVTGADGKKIAKARDFLNTISAPEIFNPIQWVRLGGGDAKGRTERLRQQRDTLLAAIPLTLDPDYVKRAVQALGEDADRAASDVSLDGVDWDQHALIVCQELGKAYYDYRAGCNRLAEESEAALNLLERPHAALVPKGTLEDAERAAAAARDAYYAAQGARDARRGLIEQRDRMAASVASLAKAAQFQEHIDKAREDAESSRAELDAAMNTANADIARIEGQLRILQDRRKLIEDQKRNVEAELHAIDTAQHQRDHYLNANEQLAELQAALGMEDDASDELLEGQMRDAEEALARKRAELAWRTADEQASAARARSATFDLLVGLFRDTLPADLIAQMPMPVEGLGLRDGIITIHDVPLHQLGTSEQIRVGVQIAAALNPNSGFILIDGAESMGRSDRKALAEAARELDLQLIMTTVDPDAQPAPGVVVMRGGSRVRDEDAL